MQHVCWLAFKLGRVSSLFSMTPTQSSLFLSQSFPACCAHCSSSSSHQTVLLGWMFRCALLPCAAAPVWSWSPTALTLRGYVEAWAAEPSAGHSDEIGRRPTANRARPTSAGGSRRSQERGRSRQWSVRDGSRRASYPQRDTAKRPDRRRGHLRPADCARPRSEKRRRQPNVAPGWLTRYSPHDIGEYQTFPLYISE